VKPRQEINHNINFNFSSVSEVGQACGPALRQRLHACVRFIFLPFGHFRLGPASLLGWPRGVAWVCACGLCGACRVVQSLLLATKSVGGHRHETPTVGWIVPWQGDIPAEGGPGSPNRKVGRRALPFAASLGFWLPQVSGEREIPRAACMQARTLIEAGLKAGLGRW
jgi:hypothetical protein